MTWAPWSSHGVTMGIKYLIMPTAPGPRATRRVGGTWAGKSRVTSYQLRVTKTGHPPRFLFYLVALVGLEPTLLAELDFESSASTNSATGPKGNRQIILSPPYVPQPF